MIRNLSHEIGRGAEGRCFQSSEGETVLKTQSDIEVPLGAITVHIEWQTPWLPDHYPNCAEAYGEIKTPILRFELSEDFLGVLPNGELVESDAALEVPFLANMEEIKLRYSDLVDPEKGPEYLKEMYSLVVKADHLYNERQLGLDPYGGEIMLDLVGALREVVTRKLESLMPGFIRAHIRREVFDFEGLVRNVVILDEETREKMDNANENSLLGFIDLGMHDFSKGGRFKPVTKTIHHLMFGSLIEIIKRINQKHDPEKRICDQEIEMLDSFFNGNIFEKKISLFLVDIMMPLLEESAGR